MTSAHCPRLNLRWRQVPDGQRDAPDGFLADVYGACLPPMDPKAPAATLVATLDGNALLEQPPH